MRELKFSRGTSPQEIKFHYLLPGRRQPEVAVTVVIRAEADAETPRSEVADADAEAVRVDIRTTNVNVFKQPLASSEEVSNDGVNHHLGLGRFLIFRKERLLIVPRFVRRVGDGFLSNQFPTDHALIFRELLVVIPGILVAVKDRLVDLATDVEDGQLEDGDEDMRVFA